MGVGELEGERSSLLDGESLRGADAPFRKPTCERLASILCAMVCPVSGDEFDERSERPASRVVRCGGRLKQGSEALYQRREATCQLLTLWLCSLLQRTLLLRLCSL